jgi:hypothetical protein
MFAPGVEAAAAGDRVQQHRAQAPVAAGEHPFHEGETGVVVLETELAPPQAVMQEVVALLRGFYGDLGFPLERGVRLGHKGGDRDIDVGPARRAPAAGLDPGREIDDPLQVGLFLGGKAHHEVELDQAPAEFEGAAALGQEIGLGDPLVDDPPEPFGAGLRRQGQAGLADLAEFGEHPVAQGADAQTGEGDPDAARFQIPDQVPEQRLDRAVVPGRQGEEGNLLVAAALQGLLDDGVHGLGAPLPHRTVDESGLAEPAAPGAAAADLHRHPVVDGLHEGDDGGGREGGRIEVDQETPPHPGIVAVQRLDGADQAVGGVFHGKKRGDIHPVDAGQPLQKGGTGLAGRLGRAHRLADFKDRLFAVADQGRVDEIGQGFGVEGARPAHQDQGIALPALPLQQWDSAHAQHLQDVAVAQFILEGEADQVELPQRDFRFQGGQGQAPPVE